MGADGQHTVICEDTPGFVEAGCGLIASALLRAIRTRGSATVALAGGSTPIPVYESLAGLALPWDRVELFWGDERAVPHDHEHSNAGAAHLALLDPAGVPAERIHPMPGDADDLAEAAAAYERTIREIVGEDPGRGVPRLDLVILGMGSDGHTASLLPGSDALGVTDRLVVATRGGEPVDRRLTLTYPAINAARTIIVMARGAAKGELMRSIRRGEGEKHSLPVAGVRPAGGRMLWLLDAEAASAR